MTTTRIQYGQRRATGLIHIFDVPTAAGRSLCGKSFEQNIVHFGQFASTPEELRWITNRPNARICALCETILSMRKRWKEEA